jgi:hypothetical protein
MNKLSEWKLAQKLNESGRRGMIIGMCVAILIIVAVIIAIVKIKWVKRTFNGYDMGDLDEDYYLDEDDIDENGCCYTNEKDFV